MQQLADTPLFLLAFGLGKFVLDCSGGYEIVLKGEDWQVHSFFLHDDHFDRRYLPSCHFFLFHEYNKLIRGLQ